MPEPLEFGHLIEGVVEQDPLTDRYLIKIEKDDGTVTQFDIQAALARYKGQEVRLTLASFEAIEKLASMVEAGDISLEDAKLS
jgi:hypothetical protein